jgi:hypothetical protein
MLSLILYTQRRAEICPDLAEIGFLACDEGCPA